MISPQVFCAGVVLYGALMIVFALMWVMSCTIGRGDYPHNALFWVVAIFFPPVGIAYAFMKNIALPVYRACKRDCADFICFR